MNFSAFVSSALLPSVSGFVDDLIGDLIPGFTEFGLNEAISGAVSGAAINALTGQDPLRGAAAGGLTPVFQNILGSSGLSQEFQAAISGGLSGAIMSEDMLTGALGGAAGGLFDSGFFDGESETPKTTEPLGYDMTTDPETNLLGDTSVSAPVSTPEAAPSTADVIQQRVAGTDTPADIGGEKNRGGSPVSGLFDSEFSKLLAFGALQGLSAGETAKLAHESRLEQISATGEEARKNREKDWELEQRNVRAFTGGPMVERV